MKMIAMEVVRERLLDHIHQVEVKFNFHSMDRICQKYIVGSCDKCYDFNDG